MVQITRVLHANQQHSDTKRSKIHPNLRERTQTRESRGVALTATTSRLDKPWTRLSVGRLGRSETPPDGQPSWFGAGADALRPGMPAPVWLETRRSHPQKRCRAGRLSVINGFGFLVNVAAGP